MVKDSARLDNGGRHHRNSFLGECSHRVRRRWLVHRVETTVVVLDECVSSGAVVPIVGAEGVGFDLRMADKVRVLRLEHVLVGDAVYLGSLQHTSF